MLRIAITTLFPLQTGKVETYYKRRNLEAFDNVLLQIHRSVGDRADLNWRMVLVRLKYMQENK